MSQKIKPNLLMSLIQLFSQALPSGMIGRYTNRKETNMMRRYGVEGMPAPDKNSDHPGSVLGAKIKAIRKAVKTGKPSRKAAPTNHQRVVMSRAARMGLTIREYQIKWSKE